MQQHARQSTWLFGKEAKEKKVILVTGASSGMGKDAALTLLERGHTVYGAARRVEQMKDLVEKGGYALKMDVTSKDQIVDAVQEIMKEQGKLDVLVNNAGYAVYGSVEDITMEEARRQFDVNIFGVARLTKEVLPHMRSAGKGTIINLSSMGGRIYTPFGAWYHATKHAMEGWSDCLRVELEPFNIKVAIVEPGAIETEFSEVMMQPMIDRSKGSPYEPYVNNFVKNGESMESNGSPPSLISKIIVEASESRRPKRRYLAGATAKPLVYMRRWLGDGVYDFIMLRLIKSS